MNIAACGGALRSDCPWYVERREDKLVLDQLAQGENCYVLTSHQMGKSSLVVRLVDKLRKSGQSAVAIDLAAFGCELNPSQWYSALLQRVGRQLRLEDDLDAFWTAHPDLSPFERFAQGLKRIVKTIPGRLFFFIDEIDLLRSLPFSPDEFLHSIHAAYEGKSRGRSPFVYCMLGTVAPPALWEEPTLGSSTLGRLILLREFEREDLFALTGDLAEHFCGHPQIPWNDRLYTPKFLLGHLFDRVFYWTSGHPYLTQKLGCAATLALRQQLCTGADVAPAQCQDVVDELCSILFTSQHAREQDCHFLWIRQKLLSCGWDASRVFDLGERSESRPDLGVPDDEDSQTLISSGVIRVDDGCMRWRNRIYERVFDGPWLSNSFRPLENGSRLAQHRRSVSQGAGRSLALNLDPCASWSM